MKGYDPRAAAKTMLVEARNANVSLTNLKVQKLLYFAHGLLLAREEGPLVNEPFQAWKYGPVIESLYHKLKVFGPDSVSSDAPFVSFWPELPEQALAHRKAISDVLTQFGTKTGGQLVQLSHDPAGPWSKAYTSASSSIQIEDKSIKQYFKQHLAGA